MKAFAKKIAMFSAYAAMLGVVAAVLGFFYFSRGLPTIEQIAARQVSQSTKIFDRSGEVLLYEIGNGQRRTVVPLEEIPRHLKEATIAIEDRRFYDQPAFDVKAIARAFVTNLKRGNPLEGQGASTITQQLARNAFLTPERTIWRKIRELILATRIDEFYSKDEILEFYLNEVAYGPTLYGVEAASRAYFDKNASELNLAESAILASLPKAPTYYSPWGNHLQELFGRQKLVLETMLALGKITKEELNEALEYVPKFSPRGEGLQAPHFTLSVQDYLVQKYGEDLVREGGLRVITTLDWELQEAAEDAVKSGAEENGRLYGGENAALVAQNARTGEILALAGSRDYFATSSLPEECTPGANCRFEPNFNVATQGLRQPGSALKPFIYLEVMKKGYTPDTVIFDVPTEFAADHPDCPPVPNFANDNKNCFHPENFDGVFRGPVSLRQALGQSINVPAVKTLYLAGLEDAVNLSRSFGLETLTSPHVYGLSLVLGGGAVRLIDLVGAYSTLTQEGVRREQTMVLEVRDSKGNVLESHKPNSVKVAEAQPARLINNVLSDIDVRRGLFQNSLNLTVFEGRDVALKTGTSNDYRDAWAIGYTPSFVAGVWAGNNNNEPMTQRGSSLLAAVPIWNKFMSKAIGELPYETFTRPDPPSPEKPILAGDYLWNNQLHSLLFYVDRKNPAGPPPQNPEASPQFVNWETGVLVWAQENLENFELYNQPFSATSTATSSLSAPTESSPPLVSIGSPAPGSFVGKKIKIFANISASVPLERVNVYWNGGQLQGIVVNGANRSYPFDWELAPPILRPQNLLEVEAVDRYGRKGKEGVIVYHEAEGG